MCRTELLVVTGTTLARSPMRETVLHLMRSVRRGRTNVMDVDYRPMLWNDEADSVLYYDLAVRMTDVLIGNEVESRSRAKCFERMSGPVGYGPSVRRPSLAHG